jgi:hypothetical protein
MKASLRSNPQIVYPVIPTNGGISFSSALQGFNEDEIPPFVGMTGFGDQRSSRVANRSKVDPVMAVL